MILFKAHHVPVRFRATMRICLGTLQRDGKLAELFIFEVVSFGKRSNFSR